MLVLLLASCASWTVLFCGIALAVGSTALFCWLMLCFLLLQLLRVVKMALLLLRLLLLLLVVLLALLLLQLCRPWCKKMI